MKFTRRQWLAAAAAGMCTPWRPALADTECRPPLLIKSVKIIPVALPDPPILAASGCHGPYFLRNVVELETEGGIVGWGETRGGERLRAALEKAVPLVIGKNAFAYRRFAREVSALATAAYAGIEMACLDACGQAVGKPLCELLGGPVCDEVEFAAYLFYRYAADHPKLLADPRIVDARGKGDRALDQWGEVRTPEAMVRMARAFQERFGFRVFKLKAGVLPPDQELETMVGMNAEFKGKAPLRIDPNARWRKETALRIAKKLKDLLLEYYEDPVQGQEAMAEVRRETGLRMSTNMCVTRFEHIQEALRLKPVDVVLCDHHGWGGIPACQELGRIADLAGWTLSQHSNNHGGLTMAAMVHVAAVTPQITLASDTHYPWLPEPHDLVPRGTFRFKNGRLPVPKSPGLGVRPDRDRLMRAHEVYQKCGMRERDDAATMQLVQPGWKRELF